jgi:hypothetical protein
VNPLVQTTAKAYFFGSVVVPTALLTGGATSDAVAGLSLFEGAPVVGALAGGTAGGGVSAFTSDVLTQGLSGQPYSAQQTLRSTGLGAATGGLLSGTTQGFATYGPRVWSSISNAGSSGGLAIAPTGEMFASGMSGSLVPSSALTLSPALEGLGPVAGVASSFDPNTMFSLSSTSGHSRYAAHGQSMHNTQRIVDEAHGYETRLPLPSGARPDGRMLIYNRAKEVVGAVVKELKPDNFRAIQRGLRQLDRYADEISRIYGIAKNKVQQVIQTYRRK